MRNSCQRLVFCCLIVGLSSGLLADTLYAQQGESSAIVLRAARLLQVDTGKIVEPGEILVQGDRIRAVGTSVAHPAGARIVDLGDKTLMPGLIDAHVHLF